MTFWLASPKDSCSEKGLANSLLLQMILDNIITSQVSCDCPSACHAKTSAVGSKSCQIFCLTGYYPRSDELVLFRPVLCERPFDRPQHFHIPPRYVYVS